MSLFDVLDPCFVPVETGGVPIGMGLDDSSHGDCGVLIGLGLARDHCGEELADEVLALGLVDVGQLLVGDVLLRKRQTGLSFRKRQSRGCTGPSTSTGGCRSKAAVTTAAP